MIKKIVIACIFVLTGVLDLFSQPLINGFVEYDNITYFKDISKKYNGRNQGIFQLEAEHQLNKYVGMFSSVEFRSDQSNTLRDRIYLDEAYINISLGNFDFRLGKQIYKWGKSDAINPTNYFSNNDYTDVLDTEDEEIGVISLDLKYYLGNLIFEGVVAPSFTPSILPDSSTRWWPAMPEYVVNPLYPGIGNQFLQTNYIFPSATLPETGIESFQYSLKLSGFLHGLDYSLSWFNGISNLPDLFFTNEIDTLTFSKIDVTSIYTYNRLNAFGLDLALNIGQFSVRGEAAYFVTEDWEGEDPLIDDPYLQYVVGIDRFFLSDKLFALAQWTQEVQFPDRNTEYSIYDLKHIFRKSLLGRIEYKLKDRFKLSVQGVYNIDNEDFWIQPTVSWDIYDGIKLDVIYDHLEGSETSFFGLYKDNKRFQIRLKYNFSNKKS